MRIERSAPVLAVKKDSVDVKTKKVPQGRITVSEFVLGGLALVSLVVLVSYAFSIGDLTHDPSFAASSEANTNQIQRRMIDSSTTTIRTRQQPTARSLEPQVTGTTARVASDSLPATDLNASSMAEDGGEQENETLGTVVSDPIAMTDPLPDEDLSEQQVNQLAFMREQFVELLGGTDQDPTQPQYLKRWEQAQKLLDDEFRSFFGEEMFNRQQLLSVAAANP